MSLSHNTNTKHIVLIINYLAQYSYIKIINITPLRCQFPYVPLI